MDPLVTLFQVLSQTLQIYSLVLIVRVLLSWFPNLDWSNPVLSTVSSITDPYLNAFRGLIPPLGGMAQLRSGTVKRRDGTRSQTGMDRRAETNHPCAGPPPCRLVCVKCIPC